MNDRSIGFSLKSDLVFPDQNDTEERYFTAIATSRIVDSQGEIMSIDELKPLIPVMNHRGAANNLGHFGVNVGDSDEFWIETFGSLMEKYKHRPHVAETLQDYDPNTEALVMRGLIKEGNNFDDIAWDMLNNGEINGVSFGGQLEETGHTACDTMNCGKEMRAKGAFFEVALTGKDLTFPIDSRNPANKTSIILDLKSENGKGEHYTVDPTQTRGRPRKEPKNKIFQPKQTWKEREKKFKNRIREINNWANILIEPKKINLLARKWLDVTSFESLKNKINTIKRKAIKEEWFGEETINELKNINDPIVVYHKMDLGGYYETRLEVAMVENIDRSTISKNEQQEVKTLATNMLMHEIISRKIDSKAKEKIEWEKKLNKYTSTKAGKEFKEEEHPRDGGKFSKKPGAGKKPSESKKPSEKPSKFKEPEKPQSWGKFHGPKMKPYVDQFGGKKEGMDQIVKEWKEYKETDVYTKYQDWKKNVKLEKRERAKLEKKKLREQAKKPKIKPKPKPKPKLKPKPKPKPKPKLKPEARPEPSPESVQQKEPPQLETPTETKKPWKQREETKKIAKEPPKGIEPSDKPWKNTAQAKRIRKENQARIEKLKNTGGKPWKDRSYEERQNFFLNDIEDLSRQMQNQAKDGDQIKSEIKDLKKQQSEKPFQVDKKRIQTQINSKKKDLNINRKQAQKLEIQRDGSNKEASKLLKQSGNDLRKFLANKMGLPDAQIDKIAQSIERAKKQDEKIQSESKRGSQKILVESRKRMAEKKRKESQRKKDNASNKAFEAKIKKLKPNEIDRSLNSLFKARINKNSPRLKMIELIYLKSELNAVRFLARNKA